MKVIKIIDSEAKSGEKNGKHWSTSKVLLDNDQEVYIFNPISENDEVESYENKGYTNWRKVKETTGSTDIDKAFKIIYTQNKEILAALDTVMAAITDLSEKGAKPPEEEISLDDIPFGDES